MIDKMIITHPYNDDIHYYNGICTDYRSLQASKAVGATERKGEPIDEALERHVKLIEEWQDEHPEYFI